MLRTVNAAYNGIARLEPGALIEAAGLWNVCLYFQYNETNVLCRQYSLMSDDRRP